MPSTDTHEPEAGENAQQQVCKNVSCMCSTPDCEQVIIRVKLYLKSNAASGPFGHDKRVSSAAVPDPTSFNGQGMTTSCASCVCPASNTVVSPALQHSKKVMTCPICESFSRSINIAGKPTYWHVQHPAVLATHADQCSAAAPVSCVESQAVTTVSQLSAA